MISRLSSRSRLISRFIKKIQDSIIIKIKIQDSKIQESREDLIKISIKMFFKTKYSTILFYKRVFSNFSKLPEYLLSGNRLPVIKF